VDDVAEFLELDFGHAVFSLASLRVIGSVGSQCRTGKSMTVAWPAVIGRVDIR
jgi:spore coat protein U-like protein